MDVSELNNIRKNLGLSVEELSIKANLPKSTVEKIIFGVVKHPRIDTVQAIENALGLNVQRTEEITQEEKELISLISQLTEDEVKELSNFVDYIISKREK